MLVFTGSAKAQQDVAGESTVQGVAETQREPDALLDPNLYMGIHEAYQRTMKMRGEAGIKPDDIKTLFFTRWQHALLLEAKPGLWRTRQLEEYEKNRDPGKEPPRIRGPRELSLGGIVYTAGDEWVVWLNGQLLTPEAIPKEVMDIQVKKDLIELKWYDSWTNLIYPIRLRPHQRFNLDTKIFLPGTSTL